MVNIEYYSIVPLSKPVYNEIYAAGIGTLLWAFSTPGSSIVLSVLNNKL